MLTRRRCAAAPLLASVPLASLALAAAVRPARAGTRRLRLGGTGMALAAMRMVGSSFAARHPDVVVEVLPSLGTGGGLSALAAGAIDLALSARPLTDAERARGLGAEPYARTPVAFVTHERTAAAEVTMTEVARILRGDTLAWPDGSPVRLVRREPSDADWTLLRALSPEMGEAVEAALRRPGLLTVATDQENADALAGLRGSFGAVTIGQLRAEARPLKPLLLDGVAPEVGNLASGRYPLSRTLHVAWRGEAGPTAAEFLSFLRAPAGRAVLLGLGHETRTGAA